MVELVKSMPMGVRIVLGFGFVLLAGVGLTLPLVVQQAVEAPISAVGLLWMLLLAYLIFTLTLILQRKQAAWMLSLGLASLSIPLAVVLFFGAGTLGGLASASRSRCCSSCRFAASASGRGSASSDRNDEDARRGTETPPAVGFGGRLRAGRRPQRRPPSSGQTFTPSEHATTEFVGTSPGQLDEPAARGGRQPAGRLHDDPIYALYDPNGAPSNRGK
jgi:hypothetical protein